jgi:hypothetical protein
VRVVEVVPTGGVPYGVSHLGKADASESCSDPACRITAGLLPAPLFAGRERAVRFLLLQGVTRLLLDATRRTHVLIRAPLAVVVLPWCVHDRGAGVETTFAYTDVLGVLLHLLDVFVILPPVDEFGDGISVLVLLSHTACRV